MGTNVMVHIPKSCRPMYKQAWEINGRMCYISPLVENFFTFMMRAL